MFAARYAREMAQRYRMEAARCGKCQKVLFPPRPVCPGCGGREFATVTLPNEGVIDTFTVIRVSPPEFSDQAPYALGIVNLGGTRVTMQIADIPLEAVAIGQKVRVEFRKVQVDGEAGIACYGYKAVPA